jgi:hypothetical protein
MADTPVPPSIADWTAIVDRYSAVEGLVRFDAWLAKFPTHEARIAELGRMERLWSAHVELDGWDCAFPEEDEEHLRLAAIWRLRHQFWN